MLNELIKVDCVYYLVDQNLEKDHTISWCQLCEMFKNIVERVQKINSYYVEYKKLLTHWKQAVYMNRININCTLLYRFMSANDILWVHFFYVFSLFWTLSTENEHQIYET